MAVDLGKAKSLLDVGNTQGLLERGDGASGVLVEELVDLGDAKAVLKHGNGLADGLDGAGRGALVDETEEVLGEGDTEGILKLERSQCQYDDREAPSVGGII